MEITLPNTPWCWGGHTSVHLKVSGLERRRGGARWASILALWLQHRIPKPQRLAIRREEAHVTLASGSQHPRPWGPGWTAAAGPRPWSLSPGWCLWLWTPIAVVVPEKETLNTVEARAIPVHPGMMLETAVSPGETRHQEPWRHKYWWWGHQRHLRQRWTRVDCAASQINQRKHREEKLKKCATVPPTDTLKKGLSLPTCWTA